MKIARNRVTSLYSRLILSIVVVMIASASAFRPFFITAARYNSGASAKFATSFKEDVLNKHSLSNGNLTEKTFKKDAKLGVLFLNLGGPETIKVMDLLFQPFDDQY